MYHILLVDDEWLELDTLEKYIPWEEMGFSVVGTASNGSEALKMLKDREAQSYSGSGNGLSGIMPDVLLTDVKMPVMDGVALSKEVHKRYPDMQIVFLSGYNDFEYVREALSVEACGYILKPLNPEELKANMEKAKERCSQINRKHKNQAAMAAESMKSLLGFFGERRDEEWDDVCRTCNVYLHLPLDNRFYYIGLLTIDEYPFLAGCTSNGKQLLQVITSGIRNFTQEHKILSFHINDSSYLLLADFPLKKPLEEYLADGNDNAHWITACTYSEKQTPGQFPALYEEMARYRKWHVRMYGSGHVIVCDTFTPDRSAQEHIESPDFSALIQRLQSGNMQEIQEWLSAYCLRRKGEDDNLMKGFIDLVDRIYSSVILPNTRLAGQFEEKADLYKKLTLAESSTLMEKILLNFLAKISLLLSEESSDRRKQLVEQVKNIIRQEYAAPLTIEYLAERVYMSPNYLRTLFKEYSGETVLEYITGVRMEISAKLLRETNLRVHDISRRIGYENPSHYCAVFKKQTGFTPNQYRTNFTKEVSHDQ